MRRKAPKTMSLDELSREYRTECARLRLRIKELERMKNTIPLGEIWEEIDRRQKSLSQLLKETREVSQYLEHYYDEKAREYGYSLSGMLVRKGED